MNVLVVGGAGYIGSHCVKQLQAAGHRALVLDNLVFGHRSAISDDVTFYNEDLGNRSAVAKILLEEKIDLVMHFAAFAYVGESVTDPLKYYENNVGNTIQLLLAMTDAGVKKFVFSSTCATYGEPDELPIVEDTPQSPINPYGTTKLHVEHILKDLAHTGEISSAVFRYFNASGAAEDGSIGEDHAPETHLIPLAIAAATGQRGALKIFGTDYPTPDGTCLRDYIHVDDLARAHISVFDQLAEPNKFVDYNLGTGKPTSVREILDAVEKVSGLPVPAEEAARREGDPPSLYADNTKARTELGWEPQYMDIESNIATAWKWHQSHPDGYGDTQD
ncbi:UDP-glucose 4-epimerase GalE [Verrucomicrobiaceae bacterium R5-34]|uniref:UDP-glucose 4-epimerase n=1 Tax=Oceaniferula flava TaxID=2800421 RepID=A0AAE2SAZ9_9BACT|nr:UDP-glucose 4-epimerase GalE [Oceaniferula flavus]MBK1830045.1 UDP-glucose 4-epimerase GalE [Verrucomicrobiaceae bacterium R5-34]MBK1855108.1 UDP-glucose 4-epimerase GalE [Oceaniferula flavus]MBM1136414.1 UDP-glucose 4-epimerase GalE [Oceaniferula flavus]